MFFGRWGVLFLASGEATWGKVRGVRRFGQPFVKVCSPTPSGDKVQFISPRYVIGFSPRTRAQVVAAFQPKPELAATIRGRLAGNILDFKTGKPKGAA